MNAKFHWHYISVWSIDELFTKLVEAILWQSENGNLKAFSSLGVKSYTIYAPVICSPGPLGAAE